MNPSGDYKHQQGADYGSGHYRPELGGDDIEVKHESYTGRYEEEAQVGNQEVGQSLHPLQLYPTQLQKKGEKQHPYDTGRQLNACQKNNQFTQSQTSEKDGALTYHTL